MRRLLLVLALALPTAAHATPVMQRFGDVNTTASNQFTGTTNNFTGQLGIGFAAAPCSTCAVQVSSNGKGLAVAGTAQVSTLKFDDGTQLTSGNSTVATRQIFTSGTSATYTTPAGARQLKVRMCGGGGGGAAVVTNSGTNGGNTTFNSVNANGGTGGSPAGGIATGAGGAGGTGGTGSANLRYDGGDGDGGAYTYHGGKGGDSAFGGGGGAPVGDSAGKVGKAYCSGGSGGVGSGTGTGGGGGAGEYVELIINSPSATYTYTVGAAGTGGAAGTQAGGNGKVGIIIVDEYY